jgi:hypothetical protein
MFSIHASEMPGMKNAKAREAVLREMISYVTAGITSRPAVSPSERPPLPVPPKLKQTQTCANTGNHNSTSIPT